MKRTAFAMLIGLVLSGCVTHPLEPYDHLTCYTLFYWDSGPAACHEP